MSLNMFGVFEFDAFHRVEDRAAPPNIIAETAEILQRPGYDGTAIIKLGRKEEPFQMRSVVGCTTQAAALALSYLYKQSQNTQAYQLIWGGVDYTGTFETQYVPLRVDIVKVKRLSTSAGGIYGPICYGLLEAVWTLQPVVVPEEA